MKRTLPIAALAALALAGCGGSAAKPPSIVLSNGQQLIGNAALSWCELQNVALNYPSDSSTFQACKAVSDWADRGKPVINISPSAGGGLNETTTTGQ